MTAKAVRDAWPLGVLVLCAGCLLTLALIKPAQTTAPMEPHPQHSNKQSLSVDAPCTACGKQDRTFQPDLLDSPALTDTRRFLHELLHREEPWTHAEFALIQTLVESPHTFQPAFTPDESAVASAVALRILSARLRANLTPEELVEPVEQLVDAALASPRLELRYNAALLVFEATEELTARQERTDLLGELKHDAEALVAMTAGACLKP